MKCTKCEKEESRIKSKGLCSKCYAKEYRKNNQDKVKAYRKMRQIRDHDKIIKFQRRMRDLERFGGNRKKVLKRDNFQCQDCGMYQEEHLELFGESLTIHHKDNNGRQTKHPNNDLDNLITLCVKCHSKLNHIQYMKKKYGALLEQDDSNWKYPKIRELVQDELSNVKTIGKAKHLVANKLGFKFSLIDQKYYKRKLLNSDAGGKRNG